MSLSYALLCYDLKGHRPSETTKYKLSFLFSRKEYKISNFCFSGGFSGVQNVCHLNCTGEQKTTIYTCSKDLRVFLSFH